MAGLLEPWEGLAAVCDSCTFLSKIACMTGIWLADPELAFLFAGMAGSLKPWEGPSVVLDGSTPFLGIARESGMWGGAATAAATFAASPVVAGDVTMQDAAGAGGRGVAGGGALQQEVARLRAELGQAQAEAQRWQALHKGHKGC